VGVEMADQGPDWAPGAGHGWLRSGMIHVPGSPRRHVVRMTNEAGKSTDLTCDLPWRETQGMIRRLRQLFSDREARARGWSVAPAAHGFTASRASLAVTFSISAVSRMDLVESGSTAAGARRGARGATPEGR